MSDYEESDEEFDEELNLETQLAFLAILAPNYNVDVESLGSLSIREKSGNVNFSMRCNTFLKFMGYDFTRPETERKTQLRNIYTKILANLKAKMDEDNISISMDITSTPLTSSSGSSGSSSKEMIDFNRPLPSSAFTDSSQSSKMTNNASQSSFAKKCHLPSSSSSDDDDDDDFDFE